MPPTIMQSRTHRSLNKDAPFHRAIERLGAITSHPILGGLHHQYCRISIFGTHRVPKPREVSAQRRDSAAIATRPRCSSEAVL